MCGSSSEFDDAKSELGLTGKVLSFITIIWSLALIGCSVPFWIAIYGSAVSGTSNANSGAMLALNIIFGAILILIGVCGLFGSVKFAQRWLDMFGFVNAAMFIIQVIQLIVGYLTWLDCNTFPRTVYIPNSPYEYICPGPGRAPDVAIWFFAPTCAMLIVNLCSAFFGFSFSQKIKIALDPPFDA